MAVLEHKPEGWFCPAGNFFVDPVRPVSKALITHAHSDHARPGMGHYLCHEQASQVLRLRLGKNRSIETIGYSKSLRIGDALVRFHPSGHLPGAAQIRIEVKGEVWVVSGDYKTAADNLSAVFEPVPCHTFISECTFGLPIFQWKNQDEIMTEIQNWWDSNARQGITSVIFAYSLGKAQRLLFNLSGRGPLTAHPVVLETNKALISSGVPLPELPEPKSLSPEDQKRALVISPPYQSGTIDWFYPGTPFKTAQCSGWMALRKHRIRNKDSAAFVLSDHADWAGLNEAVLQTGAENIIAVHGFTQAFSRHLQGLGLRASSPFDKVRLEMNEQTESED